MCLKRNFKTLVKPFILFVLHFTASNLHFLRHPTMVVYGAIIKKNRQEPADRQSGARSISSIYVLYIAAWLMKSAPMLACFFFHTLMTKINND